MKKNKIIIAFILGLIVITIIGISSAIKWENGRLTIDTDWKLNIGVENNYFKLYKDIDIKHPTGQTWVYDLRMFAHYNKDDMWFKANPINIMRSINRYDRKCSLR